MRNYALRAMLALFVVLGVLLLGAVWPGLAQSQSKDECLVEFQDESGSIADNDSRMQTATRNKCTFSLRLCTNVVQAGCDPASFQTKTFHATGHCGPVAHLRVTPSGTSSVCGAFTGITVRTKQKKEGRCVVRAAVRSDKTKARHDVDKVTLLCEP
jgi:hypothetical protein